MRTLIVSSLGQVASVVGRGHVSPGLVAEMTHWPEVSEKVKEVQRAEDLKHRLAQPIGFVSASNEFSLHIDFFTVLYLWGLL